MSDLIATDKGTSATAGAGPVDDIVNLGTDMFSDPLSWSTAFDTALVGLDIISSYADPLNALISAGVGWLLEHFPGISDVWDKLMGDASAIEQIASTWQNIASSLSQSQSAYVTASREIERWSGPAAQSYERVAEAFSAALGGAAAESEALSIVVRIVGGLVATLKGIVYGLISDFIEFTVLPAILGAIATSWCTFGGSVAAAITYIEIQADIAAGRITVRITETTTEIVQISERAARVISKIERLITKLDDLERAAAEGSAVTKVLLGALGSGLGEAKNTVTN